MGDGEGSWRSMCADVRGRMSWQRSREGEGSRRMSPEVAELPKNAKNCQKSPKIGENRRNGQKMTKNAEKCQKSPKIAEMVENSQKR